MQDTSQFWFLRFSELRGNNAPLPCVIDKLLNRYLMKQASNKKLLTWAQHCSEASAEAKQILGSAV